MASTSPARSGKPVSKHPLVDRSKKPPLKPSNHPTRKLSELTYHFIAETLDNAGIPNVLVGNAALSVYGVDMGIEVGKTGIDFAVPDDQLQPGFKALIDAGFWDCANPDCVDQEVFIAPVHCHLQTSRRFFHIGLHRHSETLFRLPSLAPAEIGPRHDIAYTSDECWPKPMLATEHPVRVPSVHRYMEACVLLSLYAAAGRPERTPVSLLEAEETYWELSFGFLLDTRYNVFKYQLHEDLLPPSILRYFNESNVSVIRANPEGLVRRRLKRDLLAEDPSLAPVYDAVRPTKLRVMEWHVTLAEAHLAATQKHLDQLREDLAKCRARYAADDASTS